MGGLAELPNDGRARHSRLRIHESSCHRTTNCPPPIAKADTWDCRWGRGGDCSGGNVLAQFPPPPLAAPRSGARPRGRAPLRKAFASRLTFISLHSDSM